MNQKELLTAPEVSESLLCGVGYKPLSEGAFNLSKMKDIEIWKDVPGFEGIYEISSHGRLKSYKRNPKGYILSNINKKGGYLSVVIEFQGKVKYTRIHNLMALVFWGIKTTRTLHVHHLDENKQNNFLSNFEILNSQEHAVISVQNNPDRMNGCNNYNKYIKTYPIIQYDLNGNYIKEFRNGKEASDATGVCQRNILQVAHKTEYKPGLTRKQAGGFIWKLK